MKESSFEVQKSVDSTKSLKNGNQSNLIDKIRRIWRKTWFFKIHKTLNDSVINSSEEQEFD